MRCLWCGSGSQTKFTAEINIHLPFLRLCDQSPQRVTDRARFIYPLILLLGPSHRAVVSLKYE